MSEQEQETKETKKPKLKAVGGRGPGRPRKVEEAARLKASELEKRAADGDKQALKALANVVKGFENWRKALADQRELKRAASEKEGEANASFENVIEEPLPASAGPNEIYQKLSNVEHSWQARKEAYDEAALMRERASEKVKKWADKLEDSVKNAAQLTLDYDEASNG